MSSADGVAFDLEERTARFGEAVIEFGYALKFNPITSPLISQLIAAGTSVGANYCEADEAESKKDFRHKIAICRKEAKETKYWLRMVAKAASSEADAARGIWQEARELHLIFCAIMRTTDKNLRDTDRPIKPRSIQSHGNARA